ncbi:MAG: sugar ABC transporter permease [Limnochordia bacterium]|nr:sugar ABC transporter permease [Limnochordia bacterium]
MRKPSIKSPGEKLAPYVLLAPFLFTLVVFFGYAFVRVVYFSFTDYDLFQPPQWVGLRNYINIFRDMDFSRAMKNSLTFMVLVTASQTIIALLLALFLNQKVRGMRYFRAAYYMPSVASSVVVTLIFIWFFQRRGVLNFVIAKFSEYRNVILLGLLVATVLQSIQVGWEKLRKRPVTLLEPAFLFLSILIAFVLMFAGVRSGIIPTRDVPPVDIIWFNTTKIWPSWLGKLAFPIPLGAIMMFNIWTTAPTFMLLYLAGLQDIPRELFEAASIDGAQRWHAFRYIIIPQLKPITFLVVTMGLIGTLQMFDQVAILGGQAPKQSIVTLAFYIYTNIFPSSSSPRVGMASAAAIFLALLTFVLVAAQRKILGSEGDGDHV